MNKHERLKQLVQKYKHAWVFLYGFIYMPWFLWLEHHVTTDYHVIHSALDDKIPFLEVFIVPYLLWFVFIAAVVLYFFFTDVPGFYRLCTMLFTGMTIFLIISSCFQTVWHYDRLFSSGIIFSYVGTVRLPGRYLDQCLPEYSCLQLSGRLCCNFPQRGL